LSERYRKIIIKWKSMRGVSIGLLLTATSALVSLLFVEHLSAHGLEDKVELVRLGTTSLPIRIVFLPSIGVSLLLLFAWVYLVQETAYVRATPGPTSEEEVLSLKMVKYAALVVAIFTSSLFLPYLLGSALFFGALSKIIVFARFLEPHALRAVTMISSFRVLNENWKYPLSLNLAALILAALVLLIARRGRKTIPVRRR